MGKKSNRKKLIKTMSKQMSEESGREINLARMAKAIKRNGDNLFTYYVPDSTGQEMREVMFNPTKKALKGEGYKSDSGNEVMLSAGNKYKEILRKMEEQKGEE